MCVCKQKEDGTCLGVPLTVKDSAYMFSNSLLSTPEEGQISAQQEGHDHVVIVCRY